jgi:hypothetical protein
MEVKREDFFENNLFRYESYSCDCVKDIEHITPGAEPITTLKLQSLPTRKIRFAFAAKEGLLRLASTGSIEEKNILASLISLPNRNTDGLFDFFKKNGFLFPISDCEYESVDAHTMLELVNRIKATVRLMSAIEEPRKNYQDILHLSLYLLLSNPVSINVMGLEEPYTTCRHPFYDEIENAPYLHTVDRGQEAFDKDTYTINDTIYQPTFELDINDYNDIMSGYMSSKPGADDNRFKAVVNLYCNKPNADISIRLITDFLFHYQYEVGIIQSFDYESGIQYYSQPDKTKINDHMKKALIDIARIIIGEEINKNLDGIHPQYNVATMSPSWGVDSLMGAIYFSIFYMKPGLELYRQCANPNCSQYFLVKATSTRNKYCSPECGNATAQRNYRKRQKESQQ